MVDVRTYRPVINNILCRSCGICLNQCPGKSFADFRDEMRTVRGLVYSRERHSVNREIPPCVSACPLDQKVNNYLRLIKEGKIREALLVIRRDNPLPSICGFICHHPCETSCLRGYWDDPVSIKELKLFATTYEKEHKEEILMILKSQKKPSSSKRINIVGSGPAGLACAYELIMSGFTVSVFDALSQPGGMLIGGIPPFRLPREVVDHDIGIIRDLGVDFISSVCLGKDISLEKMRMNSDALVIATGAWQDITIGIQGEEADGHKTSLAFLNQINSNNAVSLSGKVMVIGGGNAALDAARSAKKAGAKEVIIVYRRSHEEMPAISHELNTCIREGIQIRYLTAPKRFLIERGQVKGVELVTMKLTSMDETGRRRPIAVEGSEFVEEADLVITAIGQRPALHFLDQSNVSNNGTVLCDNISMIFGHNGVFAAGDVLNGPSTVVEAIASGKKTAKHVMEFLKGVE